MDPTFSHFGICVSDLDRSLRFYTEALGFEKAESHDIG
jgi:catechol 2,3-dioxygenase-like lactoylglutathione lyase family enzyme